MLVLSLQDSSALVAWQWQSGAQVPARYDNLINLYATAALRGSRSHRCAPCSVMPARPSGLFKLLVCLHGLAVLALGSTNGAPRDEQSATRVGVPDSNESSADVSRSQDQQDQSRCHFTTSHGFSIALKLCALVVLTETVQCIPPEASHVLSLADVQPH